MASFKKFKIGNTSYDVKDANAGYSIDTNGAAIFLKNSAGTIISSISAPSGMDYDIIADEFDTTPIATGYSKYDLVSYQPQWTTNWYVSLIDNNTDTPGTGNNWVQATLNTAMLPQWMTQYMYISDPNLGSGKYWFNEGEGHQVSNPEHDPDMHVITDKGAWTSQGGGGGSYHQYSVGDYVIYNNDLYRCTGATTGQSWNSSKWTQVQIMDEIPSVPSNIVSSVSVNPIYTSGTPIAQISVTDSNGTTGTTLVAPTVTAPIILDLNTNDNLNQIELNPPSSNINLVTPITIAKLETAITNGVPCYITTKANHAIRSTLTKYNTLNHEFSYTTIATGNVRNLSVVLNVSGGTVSSVIIS